MTTPDHRTNQNQLECIAHMRQHRKKLVTYHANIVQKWTVVRHLNPSLFMSMTYRTEH
jgi:hypothetical protein